MTTVNALENPQEANAMVSAFLKEDVPDAPVIAPQPLGFVRLPGGLVRGADTSEVSYDAEVEELTGSDEEYIDRVRQGRPDKFLEALIERGTKRIGDHEISKRVLSDLLLGDAEMLAIEIRRVTYGDEMEFENFVCPFCSEQIDVTIELDDIPVYRLEETSDRIFEVPLRKGATARVRLPKFSDLIDQHTGEKLTDAERKTLFLSRVVLSIETADGNVFPVAGSPDAARGLGLADRSKIVAELGKRKVGPAYNEVKFKHETCGEEVPFPLSMGDLFPGL